MYDQVCMLTCVQVCGQKSASGGILQKPSTQDFEAESVTEMSRPASPIFYLPCAGIISTGQKPWLLMLVPGIRLPSLSLNWLNYLSSP